jgi:hypothetical protein
VQIKYSKQLHALPSQSTTYLTYKTINNLSSEFKCL